jgi:hypothetical protein
MVKNETPVVLLAAAACGGKTTILEVLALVFGDDKRFLVLDTSKVIAWHRERGTKLGQLFTDLQDREADRKLMPCKPTIHAGQQKINFHVRTDGVKILGGFWGGVPRTGRQAILLAKMFSNLKLATIGCSLEEALKGDAERPPRKDSGAKKTTAAYKMHEEVTQPGIDYLIERKGLKHLPLERKQPMADKIAALINFAGFDRDITAMLLARCDDPNHPACQRIRELDGGRKHAGPAHAEAQPIHNDMVAEFAGTSPAGTFNATMPGQFARPS